MIVCSSEYEQFFDEMISLHLIKFSNYQAWGVKIFLLYLITATHCFHQHALNGFSFQTCPAIFVASAEWWPVRCEERGEVVWSACLTGLKGQRVDSRGQSTNLSREATSPLLLRGYEIRKISTFCDCLPR